ncbi:MAG: S-methyl-5'-thioadenosine phosphorylase [Chloroflexota bacterium]
MTEIEIGVFGGSGLYNMEELTEIEEKTISTPFGDPSDVITVGTLHGKRVAFLPRHGRGHVLNPSEVPYRANVYAMKALGVKYLISVNACGSLQEPYAPGHIVVPDQLYDHTRHLRARSFFSDGLVSHISVADPFSAELNQAIVDAVSACGGTVHAGGAFITIEGPRFSTKAESRTFRKWGMDIIGMTTCPEAFLAAEAEIAYASMAHVTDYDCWHESEEPVTVEMVIETLGKNAKLAKDSLSHMVKHSDSWAGEYPAHSALQFALITDRSKITPEIRAQYGILVEKYLD